MTGAATLEVLAIGTRVRLGDPADPIPGTILGISIREAGRVTYEVVWWDGRERRSEWLERAEFEMEKGGGRAVRIGFGSGPSE